MGDDYDSDLDTPRNDNQRIRQRKAREAAQAAHDGVRPLNPPARWTRNARSGAATDPNGGPGQGKGTAAPAAQAAAADAPAAPPAPPADPPPANGTNPNEETTPATGAAWTEDPNKCGRVGDAGGEEATARAAATAQAMLEDQEAVAAKVHQLQQQTLALQATLGAGFGTQAAGAAAGQVHQIRVREVAAAATAKGVDCESAGLDLKSPEELKQWATDNGIETQAYW